jgi:uncharacterized protein YndB with AHSA1/START domain
MSPTDRIKKEILLRAPVDRVWRAVSESDRFGSWFGVDFDGPFVAGSRLTGRITPTQVNAEIARAQEPYAGKSFDVWVERLEPMRLFSFRWHPGATDVEDSSEPTTLVAFELEEAEGGTRLTITESGFDQIPIEKRAKVFADNEGGWTMQIELIAAYLEGAASG